MWFKNGKEALFLVVIWKIVCGFYDTGACKSKIKRNRDCPMCCRTCGIHCSSNSAFCFMSYKKGEGWCETHLWDKED